MAIPDSPKKKRIMPERKNIIEININIFNDAIKPFMCMPLWRFIIYWKNHLALFLGLRIRSNIMKNKNDRAEINRIILANTITMPDKNFPSKIKAKANIIMAKLSDAYFNISPYLQNERVNIPEVA